ncbi:protein of unknown function (plasmid) [Cupriavidus taiwanensis]|uniref:Uncharacterized protein n=1 Tax=Cupriavidus taiwanensis TaxID=164546 RepID=A0A9Q7V1W7_9BURK|nr:protein of unknown function [Cupriavidus taiwanensis]
MPPGAPLAATRSRTTPQQRTPIQLLASARPSPVPQSAHGCLLSQLWSATWKIRSKSLKTFHIDIFQQSFPEHNLSYACANVLTEHMAAEKRQKSAMNGGKPVRHFSGISAPSLQKARWATPPTSNHSRFSNERELPYLTGCG